MTEVPPDEEPVDPIVFPTNAYYDHSTDTWVLSYYGAGDDVVEQLDPELPAGDFSVVCQVLSLPADPTASVGLMLVGDTEPLYLTASSGGHGPVPIWLMIEYDDGDGEAICYSSVDGVTWNFVQEGPYARPTQAGLVLRYEDLESQVSATVAHYAVLEGYLSSEVVVATTQFASNPQVPAPMLMSSVEPVLHAVVGAYFGDLDFDVGKSVRWLMYFADRNFVLDVNLGDTRYYVVNWAKTFPEALSGVTGINYFKQPAAFRKESFARADKAWGYDNGDWVLFCDASEGFSVDNRSLPDDWALDPFKSYLYREVARCNDQGKNWASLPFFIFTKHTEIANVNYPIGDVPVPDPGGGPAQMFLATQPLAVPYYIPWGGLRRLVKVSALRDPSFDWTTLDVPGEVDTGVKCQIVSYAYAHWNLQDIVPPATAVEDLELANDDGYRMRKLISMVRPVTTLPVDDTMWDPTSEEQGVPGPPADQVTYNPIDIVTVP